MKITIKEYIDKYPNRMVGSGAIDIHFSEDEYRYDGIILDCSDCPDNIRKLYFKDAITHGTSNSHEIINVNNKEIDIFSSNFNHFTGDNNTIRITYCRSPYFDVAGDDNKIYHCSDTNLSAIGSRNKIEIVNAAIVDILGNDNTILAWNKGRIYNPSSSKNNTIVLSDYFYCINDDLSTKIYCFGNSVCRTVEGANNIETYEESIVFTYPPHLDPKEECKEPIDEEYGYFYKTVTGNMTSAIYNGVYTVGEWVYPDSFDEGDAVCSNGIHFFATKEQALLFSEGIKNYKILKLKVRFDDIAIVSNYDNCCHKMRARKAFVDSIVPEEEYKELKKKLEISYDI